MVGVVASASLGVSFTTATADASDMDSGRQSELIGKREMFLPDETISFQDTRTKVVFTSLRLGITIRISFENFGSSQEFTHGLHVQVPLLPMGQMRRFSEPDPFDFLELIEEGLDTNVIDLVVSSVGQQCPILDFGDAVDNRPVL